MAEKGNYFVQVKFKRGLLSKKNFSTKHRQKTTFFRRDLSGVKLAILALSLLALILILGKSINLISNLTKPFSSDILTKRQYSIDFKSSFNIAIKLNSVWLLHYDPGEKKTVVLKIPDDTYMELPKGFGNWRVGSIYNLGEEQKPQIGSELLKESLAKLLGLPVDGFFTLPNQPGSDDLNRLILSWHHNPLTIINFFSKAKTDLTPLEAFNLFIELSKVRSDKIISLDLEQTELTKSKLLPDSSRVLGIDVVNLNLFVREKMSDQQISKESINVAIFNATSHPGLAQEASRIITNLGGNPIIISNTESSNDKSLIIGSNNNYTFKRLAQVFAPVCLKIKCSIDDPRVTSSRAQINIILGEDFFNIQYKPYSGVSP